MIAKKVHRRFRTKGVAYTLDKFAVKYKLDGEQAEDLFYRFGPSSIDLDLLMVAKAARRKELPFVGEGRLRINIEQLVLPLVYHSK